MASDIIPAGRIEGMILQLRGQKVMLDRDLAALYGVETKALKRAVKRNLTRFPDDFMFVLDSKKFTALRYQIGTSNSDPRGGMRYAPMAFTEQGVAMLSSVLNSERAITVNIAIMRTFARLRHILASHADLARKYDQKHSRQDANHAGPQPETLAGEGLKSTEQLLVYSAAGVACTAIVSFGFA